MLKANVSEGRWPNHLKEMQKLPSLRSPEGRLNVFTNKERKEKKRSQAVERLVGH